MNIAGERAGLRMYMLARDQAHLMPAYERMVQRARARKMAGATVVHGIYGFGRRGVQGTSAWQMTDHTPVVVEMVDSAERIAAFVREEVAGVIKHGMVTLERAGVMMYRRRGGAERDGETGLELLGRVKDLSTVPVIDGSDAMKNVDGVLLRVFAGDSDVVDGRPLYEAVVAKARELGLSGATVLRGAMGFGANSVLHTEKVVDFSTDLPVVIELVDVEEKIRGLLPFLDEVVKEGMITMEAVRVVEWRR